MKRLSKLTIGIAAFLIMAGGLLALLGWFTGGERSMVFSRGDTTYHIAPFGMMRIDDNDTEDSVGKQTDGARNMVAFTEMNIDVDLGDVKLVAAEDYGVELVWYGGKNKLQYENEDGVLRVWSRSSSGWGLDNPRGGTATIYYPAGSAFTSVDVHTSLGSVTARTLTVTGKTVVKADMGSVDLRGTFHDMKVDASMGDVAIRTDRPKAEYSFDLDVSMGSISLDGEKIERESYRDGVGTNLIEVENDMGSVDISFQ